MAARVLEGDFLARHLPRIRTLYRSQRDAMLAALAREMKGLDVQWNAPEGGMFLWARLPQGVSAVDLLPRAVEAGVAFVPGAAFYAGEQDGPEALRTLRLSFVTATVDQIDTGIAALARALREMGPRP